MRHLPSLLTLRYSCVALLQYRAWRQSRMAKIGGIFGPLRASEPEKTPICVFIQRTPFLTVFDTFW